MTVPSLRLRDLNLSNKPSITVLGKGRKQRVIPISVNLARKIKRYIDLYCSGANADCLLFPGVGDNQLRAQGVNRQIKKYAALAHEKCQDVPLTFHFHELRRAKATHMLQQGVNLAIISAFMGHESMDTTKRYIGISDADLRQAALNSIPEKFRQEKPRWGKGTDDEIKRIMGL